MLNVRELLQSIKDSPYELIEISAPHTGVVTFAVTEPGARVSGPSGSLLEKPGTQLAILERERNKKPLSAPQKGVIEAVRTELSGTFVEAGTPLLTIRHYLTADEVVDRILKKALYLFLAPERAKYYFVPEVDKKIKAGGSRSVRLSDGQELFIMSRMKREATLAYSGPEGQIYSVYFRVNENVDTGQPLIGVCPGEQLPLVHEVVAKVRSEWGEAR